MKHENVDKILRIVFIFVCLLTPSNRVILQYELKLENRKSQMKYNNFDLKTLQKYKNWTLVRIYAIALLEISYII